MRIAVASAVTLGRRRLLLLAAQLGSALVLGDVDQDRRLGQLGLGAGDRLGVAQLALPFRAAARWLS
ncbi:MAG: hypothetical protein WDN69_10665 [Aliidongia sp.]